MKRFLLTLTIALSLLLLVGCGDDKHKMADDWENDEQYHWYTCTERDCEIQHEKAEHIWNKGTVTLEPTATKEGIMTYVCTVCKTVNTEFIEPTAKPTVTKAEWEKAFGIGSFANVTVDFEEANSGGGVESLTKYHIEADNTKLYFVTKSYSNGTQQGYFAKYQDGNLVYELDSADKTLSEAKTSIPTSENTSSMAKLLTDYGFDFASKYDTFKYNDNTKSYEAKNIQAGKVTYKTVSVSLSEGKITEIKAQAEDGMSLTMKFSFYGKTTTNPPIKEDK